MPPTAIAKVNGTIIAESSLYEKVEDNIYVSSPTWYPASVFPLDYPDYLELHVPVLTEHRPQFPPAAINYEYLKPSDTHTHCSWKGECSYYNIEVNGVVIPDGAWFYPNPKDKFLNCKDYVAFCTQE
ncbi:hypothetical protein FN846DRAFT_909802 [Sphaerosporella brunnea]|uniref:DUF427 domain-containing protein n=1 Tax=Sphaerosporella brunnea TaxID=1250544 RepID=A0A5J5EQ09_9PEZI|nr:hypothetical protein FN846DRAFT_909802 [Sphaerosporella brunnea]